MAGNAGTQTLSPSRLGTERIWRLEPLKSQDDQELLGSLQGPLEVQQIQRNSGSSCAWCPSTVQLWELISFPFVISYFGWGGGGCFLAAGGRWRITAWKIWNPEPVISTSTLYWTMVTPNIIVKGCTSTSFMDIPSSMYPFSNGQTSSGLYFLLVVKILCRKLYRHPKFELFP